MIRTDDEASGDGPGTPPVVWQPPPAGAPSTRVGQFLRWLKRERGLSFDGYDDLWRWSVDALEDFWDAIWQFFGVPASAGYSSVLSSRVMPGGRWFEGARLNYAEAVLVGAPEDRPALIAVAEQQAPREISRAELRGQVGALAAALRELGVGPGRKSANGTPPLSAAPPGLRTKVARLGYRSLTSFRWEVCPARRT